ncbi:MAG: class I SAM-dependent methyltransferase [Mycobacterium sp.]
MPSPHPSHTDRRRADSFGAVASDYDAHRPRYPEALIAALVDRPGIQALDVGAGTGIAAVQLAEAGAEVLAVEPDPRMAELAADKGIPVEQATFEDWEPDGRRFDLVVFGQSFHWVEPRSALHKIAATLHPGGRLALLSNKITPIRPSRASLDEIYDEFLPHRPAIDAVHDEALRPLFDEYGFAIELRDVVEDLHYTTDDWLNKVFTYSNILTLEPDDSAELRSRLEQFMDTSGVDARNEATALIATPRP